MLPAEDLLNAALVSKTWLEICKNDSFVRRKIRKHMRNLRKARIAARLHDNFGTNIIGQHRV